MYDKESMERLLKDYEKDYTERLELRYKSIPSEENLARHKELSEKLSETYKKLYKEGVDPKKVDVIKHRILEDYKEYFY